MKTQYTKLMGCNKSNTMKERAQENKPILYFEQVEKTTKTKVSRTERIKTRAEINEIESRKRQQS
jgi:hypothetical protein